MKVCGIIAEYNPFHNGHLYQINYIREHANADYIIAVMSPDFVQRGSFALADKYVRAEAALRGGVDLCIELPVTFATGSAELFAGGGVKLLNGLGCVDFISFGCEQPVTEGVRNMISLLLEEPESYRLALQKSLKSGSTFPAARETAVKAVLLSAANNTDMDMDSITAWLSEPNCTLALEYLKAMQRCHASFTDFPVLRSGNGYHDDQLITSSMPSASALRSHISAEGLSETLASHMPACVLECLQEHADHMHPCAPDAFDTMLYYRLLSEDNLTKYLDISDELAKRITKHLPLYAGAEAFTQLIKTRQITYTRISRALMHVFLGIEEEFAMQLHHRTDAPYARILGFRKDAAPLLRKIQDHCSIPIITRPAQANKLKDPYARASFELDIRASHLYQLACRRSDGQEHLSYIAKSEYARTPIII